MFSDSNKKVRKVVFSLDVRKKCRRSKGLKRNDERIEKKKGKFALPFYIFKTQYETESEEKEEKKLTV